MDNNKISFKRKKDILKIVSIAAAGLLHLSFIFLIINFIQYINLSKAIIIGIIGIAVCILCIVDVVLLFGLSTNRLSIKIIVISISSLFLALSITGSVYLVQVNSSISKLVDNASEVKYETISTVVAVYDNKSIKEIEDLNNKKIGTLNTTGISAASVGKQNLIDKGIKADYKEYSMTADLYTALVEGDVDAAIFPDVFKSQLSTDDEIYEEFFDKTEIIYEYEEKVQTNDSELSKKDLSSEPFTVLLIGYAPEGKSGGLTDTIILAAVNPKTMSVSMTSIARDSYVPIACYGNNRSKINDAGAASNACLMDTVENLMGVDIDFYMRVNFQGVVDIVDAVGGVYIDSPVEFTGQSSSSTRGKYNVWVPKGPYIANGEQALAFARERHAMPAGDFDRQINQQNVIKNIAQSVIGMKDVNKALKVLEAAGENFSTNMSVSQITSVLNYILTAKNYSAQSQYRLIDMKSSRLTGYTYWFYSYSMRLPLWSYYLYDGSIKENVKLIKETLGIYDEIDQWDKMNIFVNDPYIREAVYSEYFNEPHVPENMPPMYPSLIGYTYDAAVAWANENGVSINWITIDSSDPSYNEAQAGTVVAQDPRKGALIEEYPSCTLTLMGAALSAEDRVPNFVDRPINEAITWCRNNGISYTATEVANTDGSKSELVITQSVSAGSDKRKVSSIEFTYYQKVVKQITADSLVALIGKSKLDVEAFCSSNGISNYSFAVDQGASGTCGKITSVSPSSGTSDTAFVFYQAPHSFVEDPSLAVAPTCGTAGKKVFKCSVCGETKEEEVPATGQHSFGEWSLYDVNGTRTRECGVCGKTETETMTCPNGFDVSTQTCAIVPEPEEPENPEEEPEQQTE